MIRKKFRSRCLLPIAAVLLSLLLFLSCSKKEVTPPTTDEIASVFTGSFTAQTEMLVSLSDTPEDELSLSASITRSEDQCSITVTAPEHLEGLTFTIDSIEKGDLSLSYKGLTVTPGSMPGSNLGGAVAEALHALQQPEELVVTDTPDGWCATGETTIGSFSMLLAKDTLTPLSLTLPDARIRVTFTSFETLTAFRPDRIEEDFSPQESSESPDTSSESEPAPVIGTDI